MVTFAQVKVELASLLAEDVVVEEETAVPVDDETDAEEASFAEESFADDASTCPEESGTTAMEESPVTMVDDMPVALLMGKAEESPTVTDEIGKTVVELSPGFTGL